MCICVHYICVNTAYELVSLLAAKGERINQSRAVSVEQIERFANLVDFILVNVYTPNAQDGLRRLPYRLEWDEAFRMHVAACAKRKPVVFCGDLNVAHQKIDIARPKENRNSPGFSDAERESFTRLLEAGFVDTYRHLHPTTTDAYSWWSYRAGARQRNVGHDVRGV